MEIFYPFAVLLLACELGQRINVAYEECSEMVDHLDWYLLPMKVQRLHPLVLHFTQQPIDIKCFGSVECCRDTFKYVSINETNRLVFIDIN